MRLFVFHSAALSVVICSFRRIGGCCVYGLTSTTPTMSKLNKCTHRKHKSALGPTENEIVGVLYVSGVTSKLRLFDFVVDCCTACCRTCCRAVKGRGWGLRIQPPPPPEIITKKIRIFQSVFSTYRFSGLSMYDEFMQTFDS